MQIIKKMYSHDNMKILVFIYISGVTHDENSQKERCDKNERCLLLHQFHSPARKQGNRVERMTIQPPNSAPFHCNKIKKWVENENLTQGDTGEEVNRRQRKRGRVEAIILRVFKIFFVGGRDDLSLTNKNGFCAIAMHCHAPCHAKWCWQFIYI